MKLFSIYDSKAQAYIHPFALQSAAHAVRQVSDILAGDRPSPYSDYPEDFTLMEIGEWDQLTGKITSYPHFESHGNLAHFRAQLIARRKQSQTANAAMNGGN